LLLWTQNNLNSGTVVCAWWDYGYWLGILGNVTTLADNATINATQIENIGFIMMANETQSLKMLKQYDAKYILVFVTLQIRQLSTQQGGFVAEFSRFGDEAKWTWMAKISGQDRQRFIDTGFISAEAAWADETVFGNFTETGAWEWNAVGKSSTIFKLMSWAKQRWVDVSGVQSGVAVDEAGVQPEYFKETYFAGETLSAIEASAKYGGLIPIVALYEIDWEKYYSATGQP